MITVAIDYTNYRGERAIRRIEPVRLWWGVSDYHGDTPQWFISANDVERGVSRDFAMKDIHSWKPVE